MPSASNSLFKLPSDVKLFI
ncbi:hypothetical protein Gotur_023597 [Gossypium turneri]